MSKQITILVMIDVEAALAEGTLENNIYMMDSERLNGSTGEGTSRLTTAISNGIMADGSQAEDVVLNWSVGYLPAPPPTLPRFYASYRRKKRQSEAVADILRKGKVDKAVLTALQASDKDCSPYLADITGEAVERKAIFPAQYGTPVPVHGGWYWSASVNTYHTGVYKYVLHIDLYRDNNGKTETVRMTHEAAIAITNAPQRNGFTGKGLGFLPIGFHTHEEADQKKGETT